MLFRVWDKKNKCYSEEPIRIDGKGNVFYQELRSFSYSAPWYLSDDYEVEFNTGITLADGTETFFGDILRWDDLDFYGQQRRDGYEYYILRKDKLLEDLDFEFTTHDGKFPSDFEIVGNIHETELTDAMKFWLE